MVIPPHWPGVDPKGYVEDGINENTGQKNSVPVDPLYRFYNIWAKEIGVENLMDATNVRMREISVWIRFATKYPVRNTSY